MKYFFLILLFSLSSLAKPKIITSFSILAGLSQELAGDMIEVESLVKVGLDPHHFEPSARDIQKLKSADLILINGLNFEPWIEKLLSSQNLQSKTVILSRGVKPLSIEKTHHHQNHSDHESIDPHAWLTPNNALIYARNLTDALSKIEGLDQKKLSAHFNQFEAQMKSLNELVAQGKKKYSEKNPEIIISHSSLQYLLQEMGVRLLAIHKFNMEDRVDSKSAMNTAKMLSEKKVKVAFLENSVNSSYFQRLIKEYKLQLGGTLYSDSLSTDKSGPQSLSALLESNIKTIQAALIR